jgi:hypothetical protein
MLHPNIAIHNQKKSDHRPNLFRAKSIELSSPAELKLKKPNSCNSIPDMDIQNPKALKKVFNKLLEEVGRARYIDVVADDVVTMCNQVAHGPAFYKREYFPTNQNPIPQEEVIELIDKLEGFSSGCNSPVEGHYLFRSPANRTCSTADQIVSPPIIQSSEPVCQPLECNTFANSPRCSENICGDSQQFLYSLQSLQEVLGVGQKGLARSTDCSGDPDQACDNLAAIGNSGGFSKEINCTGFDCEPISPDLKRLMPNKPLATNQTQDVAIEIMQHGSIINPRFEISGRSTPTFHAGSKLDNNILTNEWLDCDKSELEDLDTTQLLSERYPINKALRIRSSLLPSSLNFSRDYGWNLERE